MDGNSMHRPHFKTGGSRGKPHMGQTGRAPSRKSMHYRFPERTDLEYILHGWSRELEERLVLPRHALHACRLEFPFDEETFTAEAPLPEDMRLLLETGD